MKVAPADADDLEAILDMLRKASLPHADITSVHLADFLVAREDPRVVGAVGFERYGDIALLRSLVVLPDFRDRGIGDALVDAIERLAERAGMRALVLLTTTAKKFFERHRFVAIDRDAVPNAVKLSTEFATLCPSTATCMQKTLAEPKRVLFVCVENSNRSQMAEAFARELGGNAIESISAGSRPSGQVNPRVIQMMAECGIYLDAHRSKSLDEVGDEPFDAVVTMGCGDACPWIPAKRRFDWALADPKNMSDEEFRQVRDEIRRRVDELLTEIRS
jgi:arsenate reductase (thioredoxin)